MTNIESIMGEYLVSEKTATRYSNLVSNIDAKLLRGTLFSDFYPDEKIKLVEKTKKVASIDASDTLAEVAGFAPGQLSKILEFEVKNLKGFDDSKKTSDTFLFCPMDFQLVFDKASKAINEIGYNGFPSHIANMNYGLVVENVEKLLRQKFKPQGNEQYSAIKQLLTSYAKDRFIEPPEIKHFSKYVEAQKLMFYEELNKVLSKEPSEYMKRTLLNNDEIQDRIRAGGVSKEEGEFRMAKNTITLLNKSPQQILVEASTNGNYNQNIVDAALDLIPR